MLGIYKLTSVLLRAWVSTSLALPLTAYATCLLGTGWLYSTPANIFGSAPMILAAPICWGLYYSWNFFTSGLFWPLLRKTLTVVNCGKPQLLLLTHYAFQFHYHVENTLHAPGASLMCIHAHLWRTASVCWSWGNTPQKIKLLQCCFINYSLFVSSSLPESIVQIQQSFTSLGTYSKIAYKHPWENLSFSRKFYKPGLQPLYLLCPHPR